MSDATLDDNGKLVIELGFDLLDRQITDRDGLMSGKVDDVELTVPRQGDPPVVTALLAGPGVLAHRSHTAFGRWIESFRLRLNAIDPSPARISFGVVRRVGAAIEITVSRDELDVMSSERWAGRIVTRIPGS